jgi:plasmid maintenance system antidote protein VapI
MEIKIKTMKLFNLFKKKEKTPVTEDDLKRSHRRLTTFLWVIMGALVLVTIEAIYRYDWIGSLWGMICIFIYLLHINYRKETYNIIMAEGEIIKLQQNEIKHIIENKRNSFELLSCPGDTIVETIQAKKMSFIVFIEQMEMSPHEGGALFYGDMAINDKIAADLQRVLGIDAEFWINREKLYREKLSNLQKPMYTFSDMLSFAGWLILDKNAGAYGYITNKHLAEWEKSKTNAKSL